MAITDDIPKFLASWSNQLYSVSDQVRNLIGTLHWLSDGRHKERILADFIKTHLPSRCEILTGFVISIVDPSKVSREVDILIVDQNVSSAFLKNGDLAMIPPSGLAAHIHVKSKLTKVSFVDALDTAHSVFLASIQSGDFKNSYPALFFFDNDLSGFDRDKIKSFFEGIKPEINLVLNSPYSAGFVFAAGRNLFGVGKKGIGGGLSRIMIFDLKDLAAAAFMANLLAATQHYLGINEGRPDLLKAVASLTTTEPIIIEL